MKPAGINIRLTPACPVGRSHVSRIADQSGMALVLVLMIVALITAMVVEFAYGVYVNTNALNNWQTSQKLSVAAKSATRLASKLIGSPQDAFMKDLYTKGVLQMSQKIPFEDLDGAITIRIEDENSKFNLNSLKNPDGYAFFIRLLGFLNLDPDIANMVSYWMNASTDHRPKNYGSIQPKNAYMDSVDELLLIPGVDRNSYDRLLPYVTIYGSGNSDLNTFFINVNTADIPVIRSLADNTSEDLAARIISYRPLTSLQAVPDVPMGFGAGHATYSGNAFHVIATAESGGIKRIAESVLEGSKVKYWKEM